MGNYKVAQFHRREKETRAAFAARVQELAPHAHLVRVRTCTRSEPDQWWRQVTVYTPAGECLHLSLADRATILSQFHATYQPDPLTRVGDWDVDVHSTYPPAPIHPAPHEGEPGFCPADQGCFRAGVPTSINATTPGEQP